MFVSFGLRFRAEVEALNLAESVGNYARHRLAPIILVRKGDDGSIKEYKVTMAPAVSGQSVAYGYMAALVQLALERKLPVSDQAKNYEKIGGFFKRADDANLQYDDRVKTCVVEDLTGFMVAKEGGQQRGVMIRRTSPVMFSYLVPDGTSGRGVVMPQLHVRYNLQDPNAQRPFQVEAGTAVYIQGIAIDVDRIGKLSDGGYVQDREKRVELAFDALKLLYGGLLFGAKKARYNPILEPLGGIASVSDKQFVVSPPRFEDYVGFNVKRAAKYLGKVSLFCFDREGITSCGKVAAQQNGPRVTRVDTLEELIDAVKVEVLNQLKGP